MIVSQGSSLSVPEVMPVPVPGTEKEEDLNHSFVMFATTNSGMGTNKDSSPSTTHNFGIRNTRTQVPGHSVGRQQ